MYILLKSLVLLCNHEISPHPSSIPITNIKVYSRALKCHGHHETNNNSSYYARAVEKLFCPPAYKDRASA